MANKGEWGEPYVALRLLAEGKLRVSDSEGRAKPGEWLDVLKVIRHETMERIVTYKRDPETTLVNIDVNGDPAISLPASVFMKNADELFAELSCGKGSSFDVSDDVRDFLEIVELLHIKARSLDKSDIFLTTLDPRAGVVREGIGFSIKTKVGHNPTLFNTARASAVKYKVQGMTKELADEINGMVDSKGHSAVSERCARIIDSGCSLEFIGFPIAQRAGCQAFGENLDLIDPRLPYVIERMLWNHFFEGEPKVDIADAVARIIDENPCNISRPEIKYPYMVKAFLYAAYCGMTASTLWDGFGQVNGGFITVAENGEVLANYALESEEFKGYLYNNCYLEFPATSRNHGDYAYVYFDDDYGYCFNLNFQVRYR